MVGGAAAARVALETRAREPVAHLSANGEGPAAPTNTGRADALAQAGIDGRPAMEGVGACRTS